MTNVVGIGTRSIVFGSKKSAFGMNPLNTEPVWKIGKKPNLVYKLSTDSKTHREDLNNAMFLADIDPQQKYFLYPTEMYELKADPHVLQQAVSLNVLLQRQEKSRNVTGLKDEKIHFDKLATTMYVDAIPYGGVSLHKLDEMRSSKSTSSETTYSYKNVSKKTSSSSSKGDKPIWELSNRQAKSVIQNLLDGLKALHTRNWVHGDNHEHNVVIQKNDDGTVSARWIDFSLMKHETSYKEHDVKMFFNVIRLIYSLVKRPDSCLTDLKTFVSNSVNRPKDVKSLDLSGYLRDNCPSKPQRSSASSPSSVNGSPTSNKVIQRTVPNQPYFGEMPTPESTRKRTRVTGRQLQFSPASSKSGSSKGNQNSSSYSPTPPRKEVRTRLLF